MRILVVDDSVVFRSQIKAAIEAVPGLTVPNVAANGKIAIQRLEQDPYDLMTLDLEMPEMDGIATLEEINKRGIKIKVIIFASQTASGAQKALEALKLGAVDVVAKPGGSTSSFTEALEQVKTQLIPKITQFSAKKTILEKGTTELSKALTGAPVPNTKPGWDKKPIEGFQPKVIVIASSTGGPNALEKVFSQLSAPSSVPILIAQHMPPVFTASLASRIGQITKIESAEGKNGELLKPNRIYVAPGDFHMSLFIGPSGIAIKLSQGNKRNSVRPAADFLFESTAEIFEQHCLGIVLTGMGEDGKDGSIAIKKAGGRVLIQDEASSIVWGMPGSVYSANAFDKICDLQECSRIIQTICKGSFLQRESA